MSINRRRISVAIVSGFFLELVNKISPLFILHHAEKTLGLQNFGLAQYQLACLEALQPLVTYGFINYAIQAVSQAQGDGFASRREVVAHTLLLKAVLATLVLFTYGFSKFWLTGDYQSFYLLAVVLFATVIDSFWLLIVDHRLAQASLAAGVLRLINLGLIFFLVNSPSDMLLFVLLSLLPNLLLAIGSGIYALFRARPRQWQFATCRAILIKSTPFALVTLVSTLFDRLDIFAMRNFFDLTLAGAYAGPQKIIQSVALMVGALAAPFYAEVVHLTDKASIYSHVKLSIWVMMVVVAPLVFGTYFVEQEVLQVVFTNLAGMLPHTLAILAVSMIGSVLLATFGLQVLLGKGAPWAVFKALLIGLAVTSLIVVLAVSTKVLWLVPFAMVFGKILSGMMCVFSARSYLSSLPVAAFVKPCIAGFAMAVALLLLPKLSLLATLLTGGFVYFLTLYGVSQQEVHELSQVPKIRRLLIWRRT